MNRFFPLLFVFCFAFGARPAQAAFINGQNYVPLAVWAHGNGLNGYTRNRGDEFVLTNRATRLVFDVDSAQAQINGVNVRLSFPVANARGVPLIAQLDLDKTVRPLLFPSRHVEPEKITTICLDPGHGGRDTGNRAGWILPRYEKTCTLALAFELRRQLQAAGFKVILTRAQDTYVELPDRPALANRRGADLFISLHFNSSPTSPDSVQGLETYCITPAGAASSNDSGGEGADQGACTANRVEDKSLLLAYQVQRALVKNLGATDRDVRRARFEVLRTAQMPAILVEGGYMSHPVEGKKIFDAGYRKQMAAAMVKGILNYQKITMPAVAPAIMNSAN